MSDLWHGGGEGIHPSGGGISRIILSHREEVMGYLDGGIIESILICDRGVDDGHDGGVGDGLNACVVCVGHLGLGGGDGHGLNGEA